MSAQLRCYKQLPLWNKDTLPQAFMQKHNTQAGTWAKLQILKGNLQFAFLDENGMVTSSHHFDVEHQPPFIEPQAWHKIAEVSDDIECQLSFYCQPDHYFNKKYQTTATHSEIIAAMPYLKGGRALDIGCGGGRNSLYLSQKGFEVDAWDVNTNSINSLKQIIAAENIQNIHPQLRDFNVSQSIGGQYDFIFSTVVFMFLQPNAVPHLIQNMQNATAPQGFNLIVTAMASEEYPAMPFFNCLFQTGELKEYYQHWNIIKYNEEIGQLHRIDANGNRIKQRFATILAQKC